MVVIELDRSIVEPLVAHHLCERCFKPHLTVLRGDLDLPLGRKLACELETRLTQRLAPSQKLELAFVRVLEPLRLGTGVHVLG